MGPDTIGCYTKCFHSHSRSHSRFRAVCLSHKCLEVSLNVNFIRVVSANLNQEIFFSLFKKLVESRS